MRAHDYRPPRDYDCEEFDIEAMGSRTPRRHEGIRPDSMPDMAGDLRFLDPEYRGTRAEVAGSELPIRRPQADIGDGARLLREGDDDRILSISSAANDIVLGSSPSSDLSYSRRRSTPRFVLPPLREISGQMLPSLVMALTSLAAIVAGMRSVLNVPIWAFAMVVPTLSIMILANGVAHPLWKRASAINLITLLAVFPMLVIRQSVSRIPFMDSSNGTLAAPVITTMLLLFGLIVVALASAVFCLEDPEYSGIVFLPAAMLVPFFAGASNVTSLRTAMLMMAAIYVVTAILTVVASMAPARYVDVIAPATIMFEFLILAAVRGADVFPLGAGVASKLLFFLIIAFTVAMTILVPVISYWARQVMLIVQSSLKPSRARVRADHVAA